MQIKQLAAYPPSNEKDVISNIVKRMSKQKSHNKIHWRKKFLHKETMPLMKLWQSVLY